MLLVLQQVLQRVGPTIYRQLWNLQRDLDLYLNIDPKLVPPRYYLPP